jgi:hypothetical protein
MRTYQKSVNLANCRPLFSEMADTLPQINRALRNINLGKMDYLPYDQAVNGYHVDIRSELIPQGPGKPPAMGHWQLEVHHDAKPYYLVMQGKRDHDEEIGDIVWILAPEQDGEEPFAPGPPLFDP